MDEVAADEIVLAGGNMNVVTRIGGTVLRQAGAWTPTVHRLLDHLTAHSITEIPTPIGRTPDGREILSFLDGVVPAYPMPPWVWAEEVLVDAARLLRRMHDATLDFDRAGAVWQVPAHEPVEVICHNDFSPHNLVFRQGRLVGAIDFDMGSPGPRIRDLAYLATRLVPLTAGGGDGRRSWSDLMVRTATLLEAYGSSAAVGELLQVADRRLLDLADFSERKADELGKPALRDDAASYRREAAWLREQPPPRLDPPR